MLKRILLPLVVAVLTAISAAGEDVVPTRDLTCGCQFCEGSGQWQLLNIVRDNLGSVTHVATAGGTLLAEYSYDAWGRLRDPQTLVPYARGQEPDLRLGRGYTGRFLGPDPVMPETGVTQTYNSYTYCLNNPLKYTDPTGEWAGWDDLLARLVGGFSNWIGNGCSISWAGASYFGVGFAGGVAALYVSPVASSAMIASANNIVAQGFSTDKNKWAGDNVSITKAAFDGIVGGLTTYLGGYATSVVSSKIGSFTDLMPGKAIANGINGGVSNGIVAL